MKRHAQHSRGQATVELALGLLIFVTVLVFGIHFSELTFLSMKVTEAGASAMYDATEGKMHSIMFSYDTSGTIATAQNQAITRYANFDGKQLSPVGAVRDVFTQQSTPMSVTCAAGGTPTFMPTWPAIAMYWGNWDGYTCNASASLSVVGFPQDFFDTGAATFHVKNYTPPALKFCSTGRATGGACSGKFASMLDDWGLANSGVENVICPSIPYGIPCPNINYFSGVTAAYWAQGASQGTAGSQLAAFTVPTQPIIPNVMGELTPYMSFTGSELMFQQPLIVGEGPFIWETTPFLIINPAYAASYAARNDCYLGYSCNNPK